MHAPSESETQFEVELDGGTVRREHMQERSFTPQCNGSHQLAYEFGREPLSSEGRVDAYRADFGETIEPHAFSRHGDQNPVPSNANVLSELNRARTERPRMCDLHERQHVGDV